MSVHDIKKYKAALANLPHLNTILYVLDLTQLALTPFKTYTSVARILRVIKEEQYILEIHRTNLSKVKNEKGLK